MANVTTSTALRSMSTSNTWSASQPPPCQAKRNTTFPSSHSVASRPAAKMRSRPLPLHASATTIA